MACRTGKSALLFVNTIHLYSILLLDQRNKGGSTIDAFAAPAPGVHHIDSWILGG